jgi:lathosterol oxidase
MPGMQYLKLWLLLFVVGGIVGGAHTGFLKARKIQPRGFKWKIFRNEAMFAVLNLFTAGTLIGFATRHLTAHGVIRFAQSAEPWWIVALEYAAYFFAFDTWFYWLHRAMHNEPIYRWVHKIHHRSTAPNMLTTVSVSPLESIVNGGFVPLFLCVVHVHPLTMALIAPTNVIMGLYVHMGYEFFPRWWNRSWFSKWFITTTFHDHHHRYFRYNFGGYTTIWDWLCGTVRPNFVSDFEKIGDRRRQGKVRQSETADPATSLG